LEQLAMSKAAMKLSRADLRYAVVSLGLAAAAITVESTHTVAPHLTSELVYARLAANRS
jgi:pseudouridine-5'-phosphate glycosidase